MKDIGVSVEVSEYDDNDQMTLLFEVLFALSLKCPA